MKENDIRQHITCLTEQIWNIDEELRTILPYIGLPYERLQRTLQIIIASCGYNSISEWFNIISEERNRTDKKLKKYREKLKLCLDF